MLFNNVCFDRPLSCLLKIDWRRYILGRILVRELVFSWKSPVSNLFNKTTVLCLRTRLLGEFEPRFSYEIQLLQLTL